MLQYSPKIITDSLLMCLDASQNKSYPTDLPVKNDLLLWLDAADDSTFSYSSGTEVSQWRDKSGNNFHANELQAVGNKPSRNTVVNGRKSLNFTSTEGDRLRVSSGMVFTNSVTAIVFIKPGAQNYDYANILDQDHAMSGGANGWVIQRLGNGSNWQSWVSNAAGSDWFNPNAISYANNTPQIVTLRKGSSTVTLYSNGTSSTDVAIADQQIRQVGYLGLNIGSWRAGGFSDRHYNGEICEIVVYNRALSLTELKQVHTYLGQKWGIFNADRCVFDLSGNGFDFIFNGANPRYNDKAFVSNFDTTTPFAISAFGGQNLTSAILNLLYTNHTIEVALNPKGFQTVYNYNNALTTQTAQSIVLWTGQHSGLYFAGTELYYVYWNSASSTVGISCNVASYQDKIMYITATRSGDVLSLYINGILVSGPATVAATTAPLTYTQMNIGCAYVGNPTTQGYVWAGQHEYYLVRMYQKALNQSEVKTNYESFKSRFANNIVRNGLVLDLDAGNQYSYAGSGATWYDVSGNAFNATLIKTPTYSSDNGGILTWNGVDQYATVPMSSTLRVTSITQEVWIYLSSTADQVFIGSQYGTGSSNSFALWLSGGTFYFGVNTGGTFYSSSFSTPSVGVWYHLVHTYGGSSQSLYINGSLAGTYSSAASGNITYDVNNTKLAIGADFNGTGYDTSPTLFVNGKMPIVKIYNISLSADQVLQNYNATKGRFGL